MKRILPKIFLTFFSFLLMIPSAQAVDINLINIEAPQSPQLQQTFANAYGYPPQQVAPAMMGPVTEVPTILQIAKSTATLPIGIWALRKMGFSYMDILKMYTLPPSTLFNPQVPYDRFGSPLGQAWNYQQQYGSAWPQTTSLSDPVLIQLGQIKFFTDYLKIPARNILSLPTDPLSFTKLVVHPYSNPTYFIPPGQAMKMGLWLPPGQAKKHWKKWDDDDDDDHGHGHGHGHGKWEAKEHGNGKGRWPF